MPTPGDRLPRRALGKTRFDASVLGIGDLADRALPLETCVRTIHRALDYGLNVIDTAPGYENGYSELIVGAALRGRRDGVFLIDKIDHLDRPVAPQVDESLRRLGLPYVDLFVFHGISSPAELERMTVTGGGMEQLGDCVQAGKVRFRGISSHSPEALRVALQSGLCDVVMFPVGPHVDRRYLEETLPQARQAGVGTVCFKTFGAGKLLGDTTGYGRPLPGVTVRAPGREPLLPRLTVGECVHYTLTCNPDVALLGMSTPDELDAAVAAAAAFNTLPASALGEVRRRAALAVQGKGACHWNP